MNGKIKATIGTVSGISVVGFIAIFSFLTNPIKEDIAEVKREAVKLEAEHNEDIKEIKKDLKKIPVIEANVKHIMTEQKEMKDDMKILQGDITEILRRVQ